MTKGVCCLHLQLLMNFVIVPAPQVDAVVVVHVMQLVMEHVIVDWWIELKTKQMIKVKLKTGSLVGGSFLCIVSFWQYQSRLLKVNPLEFLKVNIFSLEITCYGAYGISYADYHIPSGMVNLQYW